VNFAIMNHVPDERRDYDRRSAAQCRVVESVCHHLEGATCDETAAAASISATGAHRVLQRLASKHLVHCDEASRWRADPVLVSPPALCRVERRRPERVQRCGTAALHLMGFGETSPGD